MKKIILLFILAFAAFPGETLELKPAPITVTLTFDSADLAIVMPELCDWASLPRSNANAKQAIIIFIKQVHADAQIKAAQRTVQTTIDAAGTSANTLIIN